ncbi:T9SS type B sorting domain-containing protein [Psychroserpens sp. NJDZ02]|uniref:T9SS type B sorting domain-containing protein n=1 Tax=Psychroserpens sp. NJDZ02 TaxID=2570561 RepID=UPI0010A80946|nr:T9SS type B sorting domain-containing protein [Psychroserpens sp. NJDZ02]QCE41978.1 T9SS type B sorting domain-containing protein [Psychroserpens sp. NJDZ02]
MKNFLLALIFLNSFIALSQNVLMQNTTVNQCGGVFYDSGGPSANYSDNEDFILVICPDTPGNLVQLDFTAFSTGLNTDIMTIYDGDDITTAPPFGSYSGGGASANPGFISASPTNPSGCLTIQFISDGTPNASGWAATISCLEPCQTIVSQLDNASPVPNSDGYIRVCPDEPITLDGSATFSVDGSGATYEWDLGDGNFISGQSATFSYAVPGVYIVNLNVNDTNTGVNPEGCANTNLINQVIQVGTDPDFTGTEAVDSVVCFGESTTLTGLVTPVEFINDCTPPVSETTFLPDEPGSSFESCVTVDCYESSQTLTDVNQIVSICINMEHSYSGDLFITLVSPVGDEVLLHNGNIDNVDTYLGAPIDDETIEDAGVGADYCFDSSASILLVDAPTITAGSSQGNSTPGPSFVSGTYMPAETFNAFLGSPLNGDWCLRIVDDFDFDNGYIFSWSIVFDPNLQPPELSFTPVTVTEGWDADPSITSTTGNDITVQPATAGTHCYTYRTTDDFGCEYTEEVCIDVLPELDNGLPNDLFLCNPGALPYIFDLTENDAVITAPSAVPGDFNITYYETQADATAGTSAISTPASYSSSAVLGVPQTIYVRIEYLNSGCFETEMFTLNITSQPLINPAPNMETCDDAANDGFEPFDLESQNAAILGAQSSTNFVVTYYLSFAQANAGVAGTELVSDYTNTVNPQEIYARVQVVGNDACYTASALPVFELIVNPSDDTSFTITPNCTGGSVSGIVTPGGTFALNPDLGDGAVIDIATGEVTNGVSGTSYTIQYTTTVGACPSSTGQVLVVLTRDDASFTMEPTCDGGLVDTVAVPGGTYVFSILPTDSATIDTATGTITNGTPGETYTVEYTTAGTCPDSSTESVTVNSVEDPAFSVLENCDGATMNIIGDTGGVFNFNPAVTDGAVIDMVTGEVTNGVSGETYVIEYTTSGPCPENSFQNATVLNQDDPAFTVLADCNGGVVDSVVTPGGTYAFNPAVTDTAVIDSNTGTVTSATPGASYTIEYTTAGACIKSSTQVLNILSADDSTVTYVPTCDGAIATITGLSGGVFTFNVPPAAGDAVTLDATSGLISGGISNTTYSIDYSTNGPCPTTTNNIVTVYPEPVAVDPTPLSVCDDGTPDGLTSIDLSLKNNEISGGNPAYVVTYYLTQLDADMEVNPLAIPYTNISNPQTVFVRVEDVNTTCYTTTTLQLEVEQAPITFAPTDLTFCDPDSDGYGVFELTDAEAQITGGVSGLSVTYHETSSDAQLNVNPLTSPYTNIVEDIQVVYVRVESATITTACASYEDLRLIVNPTPQITDPSPLEVCDNDADGIASFDLELNNPEILNQLDTDTTNDLATTDYTITYYTTAADAAVPQNGIATPNAFTNTTVYMQTIWVVITDNANGCSTTTTMDLIVNPLPVLVQPTPLELCNATDLPGEVATLAQEEFTLEDANAQILNGQTGITLTHYFTQAGADNATVADQIFSPYTNTANAQTVYVRAEDNVTGCISTITLNLRVNPTPSPEANPSALIECDIDNDGLALFDLDSQTVSILNGEPGVSISYHETESDATEGINLLTSPYTNVVLNNQNVYVRAENDITGCFTIVILPLEVQPSPVVPATIDDYVVCDDNNDGFNQFDFDTVMSPQILGTQNPADFTLTYHTTALNAESGNSPIVNTGNYTNATNPQTIYIRLVSNTNGCVTTGQFEIRVDFPPVLVQPTPLAICDELDANYYENNDDMATFDLTLKDDEITAGDVSWIVAYYVTQADAQADVNVIADPTMYTNMMVGANPANPQTVYVRVTDSNTGCFSFTTLTIRVLPNPTPLENPDNIELCDDVAIVGPNDLIEIFDLTQDATVILNGEGINPSDPRHLSYYTDLDNALMGTTPIADPTMHSNEDPTNPGVAITPQTIYVRVTNGTDETGTSGTGCYTIVSFDIIVNPLPEVSPIEDYIYCELFSDGQYGFDLVSKTDEILGTQSATDFTLTFYAADGTTIGNPSSYTNATNPEIISVDITNNLTGCIARTSFSIEVQEGAQANPDMTPIVYELCDDNMETDGDTTNDSVQFDLVSQNPDVLDGQDPANYIVSYYATQADADASINPLPLLYENIINPQVIYVRVDNDTMIDDGSGTGTTVDTSICYETAELTLQVNPLPEVELEASYILCINTNGTEVVSAPIIETGLNTTDYTFEWFLESVIIPGETGSSLEPTQGGNYTVIVTDVSSSSVTMCPTEATTIVEESEPPTITVDLLTEAFADVHNIFVTATGSGSSIYEFSIDDGPWEVNVPNDGTYTFTDVGAGDHIVTVRDINGCGESSLPVSIMDYPHFFTPNDDGFNDTWNIYGIDDQPDAVIYIFDRYGKLLKQLSPTGLGWDGTYNGNPMPTSDYWFTVDYREPNDPNNSRKQFKAHFTLKR